MEKAPKSFLMVCLGNICRSPLAEGILQEKARAAGLDWNVDSAGTTSYHIGSAPHNLSQKVARINGVDISQQRARQFKADDFQHFDKIYAMAGDVLDQIRRIAGKQYDPTKVELFLNELHPGADEDVPDPYYGAEPGYHEVYELIDAAADKIVEKYGPAANSAAHDSTSAMSDAPVALTTSAMSDAPVALTTSAKSDAPVASTTSSKSVASTTVVSAPPTSGSAAASESIPKNDSPHGAQSPNL